VGENFYAGFAGLTETTTVTNVWPTWVEGANQIVLTNVWNAWNQTVALQGATQLQGLLGVDVGTTGVVTAATDRITIWYQWNTQVELTKEQKEARAAEAARYAEANRIAAEAMHKATERAKRLLVSTLPDAQREQLEKHQYFEIIAQGSRRRYRIHQGTHGNVRLLSPSGKEVVRYCGQPNGVPTEDAMLAQALQIMHDEDAFLKKANGTALATPAEIREAQTAVVLPRQHEAVA
jgi:hypothetical protein